MDANPEHRAVKIARKGWGVRDDELEAVDANRLSEETVYLWKHMLIWTGLRHRAFQKFPNLRPIGYVGDIDRQLFLNNPACGIYPHYQEAGIIF